METRLKKIASQLGRKVQPGQVMPSAAVGILRKKRTLKQDMKEETKGGSKVKPMKEYNPFPLEFLPGSM